MPVSKYLTLYRHDQLIQSRLLDEESGDLRRESGVPNSVFRTLQLSFDQIKTKSPSAAELLSLMAMLDRQGIPEFLLSANYPNPLDLEAAITPLNEFCLITMEKGGTSFEMHRVVQLALRKWLEQYQETERLRGKAIEIVSKAFPDGNDYSNWEMCKTLWPHAQAVVSSKVIPEGYNLAQAALLHHMASYSDCQGRYVLAEAQCRESFGIREQLLEGNDNRTLQSANLLGIVLADLGKYPEAEKIHRQVLAGREAVFGPMHSDTLNSLSNLALVLHDQGKYDEAETMHRQALAGQETVLGPMHPDTLTSVYNLACVLENQSNFEEALILHQRALSGRVEVLGPEHPSTIRSSEAYSSLLDKRGVGGERGARGEERSRKRRRSGMRGNYWLRTRRRGGAVESLSSPRRSNRSTG